MINLIILSWGLMKKIGIDIADTIIDVWPNLMSYAKEYNESHSNNKKSDDIHLYLPEDIYGWTDKEKNDFWKKYGNSTLLCSKVKNGVSETLRYLKNMGFYIFFITAKTNDLYVDLEKMIISLLNNNNIPYDGIYTQISNKGLFCYNSGIDCLIDDSYNNCLAANKYGILSMLVSNVYNRDRELKENMYRIDKFNEVKKYIRCLK